MSWALRRIPARDGILHFHLPASDRSDRRPVVLLLPGAFRYAESMEAFAERLEPDLQVACLDLPGFGGARPLTGAPGVEDLAENFAQAAAEIFAGRVVLAVGESLGGLVGVAMAGQAGSPIRRVIMLDPPLTTLKAWPVHGVLDLHYRRYPGVPAFEAFARSVFGHPPDGRLEERTYYHLLERCPVPVDVVTGSVPLSPERQSPRAPCLIDETDLQILTPMTNISCRTIPGSGHLLLHDAPAVCEDLVRRRARELSDA